MNVKRVTISRSSTVECVIRGHFPCRLHSPSSCGDVGVPVLPAGAHKQDRVVRTDEPQPVLWCSRMIRKWHKPGLSRSSRLI
jgi:hypothetical protein